MDSRKNKKIQFDKLRIESNGIIGYKTFINGEPISKVIGIKLDINNAPKKAIISMYVDIEPIEFEGTIIKEMFTCIGNKKYKLIEVVD